MIGIEIPKRRLWWRLPAFIQRWLLEHGWIEGTLGADISDVMLASLYYQPTDEVVD